MAENAEIQALASFRKNRPSYARVISWELSKDDRDVELKRKKKGNGSKYDIGTFLYAILSLRSPCIQFIIFRMFQKF